MRPHHVERKRNEPRVCRLSGRSGFLHCVDVADASLHNVTQTGETMNKQEMLKVLSDASSRLMALRNKVDGIDGDTVPPALLSEAKALVAMLRPLGNGDGETVASSKVDGSKSALSVAREILDGLLAVEQHLDPLIKGFRFEPASEPEAEDVSKSDGEPDALKVPGVLVRMVELVRAERKA